MTTQSTTNALQMPMRFYRSATLALLGAALLLLLIGQYTDIDLWLADLHYDASAGGFPWRNTWFATDLMHGYVKNVLVWIGLLVIAAALVDLVLPRRLLSAQRSGQLRILALSAYLEPLIVKSLKQTTYLQCPWSLDLYGGSESMLRILDTVTATMQKAACFPAGHASTGMWLVAIAVFWLPGNPRRAAIGYVAGLSIGLALGWVQQMRGAHFLTHTLWTAWIATSLLLLLLPLQELRMRRNASTDTPVRLSSNSIATRGAA